MKKFRFLKKIFTIVTVVFLALIPSYKAYAIDADHIKIAIDEVGYCFNTTFETFNYPSFLIKHPEIGACDKETAWAYYEMYCKPNGELAPVSLQAYMSYKQFDVDYFLSANGLTKSAGATDEEVFEYYCDTYPAFLWAARGTTQHANALIKANEDFWLYNVAVNGATTLQVIINFYALPSFVTEYYTPDNPYADPDTWNLATSIDGPMLYGFGNCQAYAKLYMIMLDMSGIPSQTVYSYTHMWNEVLYNGCWYACDTCWADMAHDHTSALTDWCMFTYNY